jgi:hypothetical protein
MLLTIFSTSLSIIFSNSSQKFCPITLMKKSSQELGEKTKYKVLLSCHDKAQVFGPGQTSIGGLGFYLA